MAYAFDIKDSTSIGSGDDSFKSPLEQRQNSLLSGNVTKGGDFLSQLPMILIAAVVIFAIFGKKKG